MSLLKKIFGGGVSVVASGVEKVAGVFKANKEKKSERTHEGDMARLEQYSAEFRQIEGRTWLDSFADAVNRLIRPALVVLVITYFVIAWKDPAEFTVINLALDTVPDTMWQILFVIISFYFVAREFHYSRKNKMAMSPERVEKLLETMDKVRSMNREEKAMTSSIEEQEKSRNNRPVKAKPDKAKPGNDKPDDPQPTPSAGGNSNPGGGGK